MIAMMMIFLTRSFPIFSIPFSQESLELGLDSDSRNSFDLSIVHEMTIINLITMITMMNW